MSEIGTEHAGQGASQGGPSQPGTEQPVINASQGGPSQPGQPAPQTQAPDLDATYRKGYGTGQSKGRERLIRELGYGSEDDLRTALNPPDDADAGEPQGDAEKLLRELKEERRVLRQDLETHKTELSRYQTQAKRALAADVRSQLIEQGAHAEAVKDLAQLLLPRLVWSSDGTEIEVVDRDPDGEARPSRLTLAELIEAQKEKRPWFFIGKVKSGAGSTPSSATTPEAARSGDGYDFHRAFDNYERRPR